MRRNRHTKGFSLIELLLVIAIIGILAGLVLTITDASRRKSKDVRVKSGIRQLRVMAEGYYNENSHSYNLWDVCIDTPTAADCLNQSTADGVAILKADIEESNALVGSVDASADNKNFCVTAPLRTDASVYICSDASGEVYEDVSATSPCGGVEPVCTYN